MLCVETEVSGSIFGIEILEESKLDLCKKREGGKWIKGKWPWWWGNGDPKGSGGDG